MAFPWSRSDAGASVPGARRGRLRRQRRAERQAPPEERQWVSPERRRILLAWGLGAGLILIIVAVLAAGYYQEFYRPPRVWAGKVRDVQFTMGDLVQRIRVEQGITGSVDLTSRPFDYLQRMIHAEVLAQDATDLGIKVTDDLVDAALKRQFFPEAPAGQNADPGQLEREYRNNFEIFLARSGLSESDYRQIMREQLHLHQLYLLLGQDIEPEQKQVEVEWVRLEVTGRVTAADVMARLRTETFKEVARNVGVSAGYADSTGYVGWVPREAFPEIAPVLFGDAAAGLGPLQVGELADPIFTRDGIYIVRKLADPEVRPLSDVIRAKINAEKADAWQMERLTQGADQGWVKMKFNDKLYQWVADQVAVSAPRNPASHLAP